MAAHTTMAAVRDALSGPNQLAALRDGEGVTVRHIRAAVRLLVPVAEPDPSMVAGLPDAEINGRPDKLETNLATQALKLLRAVLREIDIPRPMLNRNPSTPSATNHVRQRRPLSGVTPNARAISPLSSRSPIRRAVRLVARADCANASNSAYPPPSPAPEVDQP
jgi:hypothetical protein